MINHVSIEFTTFFNAPYSSNQVLHLSKNLDETGSVRWDLTLCLLLAWTIVFLVLTKGIKTLGKVNMLGVTLHGFFVWFHLFTCFYTKVLRSDRHSIITLYLCFVSAKSVLTAQLSILKEYV